MYRVTDPVTLKGNPKGGGPARDTLLPTAKIVVIIEA